MGTVFFDTFEAAKNLEGAGFNPAQTEVLVKTIHHAIDENVATKADLKALGAATKADNKAHMTATQTALKEHMTATQTALKEHTTANETALKEHTTANETALKDLGQELRQESTEAEHRTTLRAGVMLAVAVATMLAGTQILITLNGLGS